MFTLTADITMETEEQIINILRQHYQICNGKPTPLKVLKLHFGKGFKFETLGLGKFSYWLQINSDKFQVEKLTSNFLLEINKETILEDDLLNTVKEFFNRSEMYSHRKHILGHLRKIYGEGAFGDFGFGTFPEFLERHNLSMGIARREDFRSLTEWNQYKERYM